MLHATLVCNVLKKGSLFFADFLSWQGRQDLNLQPTVLETATLPIELLPYKPAIILGQGLSCASNDIVRKFR